MFYFTADEHYGHNNIIEYCNRPFTSVGEMDAAIINNHNSIVMPDDIVIHAGDFSMYRKHDFVQSRYIDCLNGQHVFLKGSHDKWLSDYAPRIWERTIEDSFIVVCHYAMRTWAKSHYNSWQLYGHSHSRLEPIGKQWDIGVDNNYFYPVSFKQIVSIMEKRPDNPNFIRRIK